MGYLDYINTVRNEVKAQGDVVHNVRDDAKTAEAIAIAGLEHVVSRGGVNAQGYYLDVPAYQQLTANERAAVTINNPGGSNHGHIDTMAMLALLDKKSIAAGQGSIIPKGYAGGNGEDDIGASIPSVPTSTPPTLQNIPEIKMSIPVKTAPIDTILIDQEQFDIDLMTDLIFEDIGGQELINIARNDTINGQTVSYQPIKNITSIQQQYNPNNILSLQDTSDKYFINFPIKLENYILGEGEGDGPSGSYAYIETETGDLIIELINLENDKQLEVQISQSGTIYEAEFNES